jgi:3-keto-disaccharide hydrolase
MIKRAISSLELTAIVIAVCALGLAALLQGQQAPASAPPSPPPQTAKPGELGYTDTPIIPGLPYHVHDPARPRPVVVTPAAMPGGAPSDAIVLFDGNDLSRWSQRGPNGEIVDAKWPVRDGYFETGAKTGSMMTRDSFGSIQLHVEWATPTPAAGTSQGRGNSGVILMGRYEVQVLDTYNNLTYPDGQAAAIYGQWPPLANVARPPGEWQTYDIVFEAPKFEGDRLVQPAYLTVFWNGVMVHNRKEVMGTTGHRVVGKYTPHSAELPLTLQDHSNPVRYRNIWVRRLKGYD